jgi:phosphatidylglycerol:prolipoprotein diacylglycerol transferase
VLTASAALPYVKVPLIAGFQPYGVIFLAALALGAVVMVRTARHSAIGLGDAIGLAGVLVVLGFCGAHVFDVLVYQRAEAATNTALWWQMRNGVSLFGGIAVITFVTWAWARLRALDLPRLADAVAVGALLALMVGRIGCALVHDHLGRPTSLPIGVDVPSQLAQWAGFDTTDPTVRLHDVGLEELVLLVPIGVVLWMRARRLRPGRTALLVALLYTPIRFGLDFLRAPATEPQILGFTAGQWSCLAMLLIATLAGFRLRDPADRPGTPLPVAR